MHDRERLVPERGEQPEPCDVNNVETVKRAIPLDGKPKWKVKDTLKPGLGYIVRIVVTADDGASDGSDGTSRIKAAIKRLC